MTVYAGIDLSWTGRHDTGLCIVEETRSGLAVVDVSARVVSTAELLSLIGGRGDQVVAGVDAPLMISTERQAERLIGRAFGKYKASAHSATPAYLRRQEMMAGPELGQALSEHRFSLDPGPLLSGSAISTALEVYPHAAHVRLFGLDERIPYKAKKGRNVAYRREQLKIYQGHLRSLLRVQWVALLGLREVQELLQPSATDARGKALKRLEDMLDAVTCAYVAYRAARRGHEGIEMLGDYRTGAVAVPR